jgi:hypothetical protein
MPDFAVTTAFKATNQYSPVVRTMGRDTKNFGNTASDAFNRASKSSTLLRGKISGIAGSIIKANILMRGARAIWEFGKGAVDLASDLVEVQNVVDTTFTEMSKDVNNFAKTAIRDFGISELQAKQYTGTIGAMIKSSGLSGQTMTTMSKNLAGLTGDFASFYNLPHEQAFQKIRAGISGETEPLKQIGINMNVANLEAFALTQGMTKQYKAMTQAEKVTLRYNYLLDKSKDAQGDFAKTLETSYANQKRVFQTMKEQTAARAMSKVLPVLTQGYAKLNEMMAKIDADKIGNGLKNITEKMISFFKITFQVLKILKPFAPIIITLISGYLLYSKALVIASNAQKIFNSIMGMSKFKIMIILIGALIGMIIYLRKNWDKLSVKGKALIIILSGIAAAISGVILVQKIMMAVGWIKYLIMMRKTIWTAIKMTKLWAIAQKIMNIVLTANPIGLIVVGIAALIAYIIIAIKYWDKFGKTMLFIAGPLGWVINAIISIYKRWDKVKAAFTAGGIKAALLEIGKALLDSLLHPIQKILEVFAKIPGVGKFAQAGADKLKAFRETYLGAVKEAAGVIDKTNRNTQSALIRNMVKTPLPDQTTQRRAPNETEARARRIDFQGRIDIANAPEGTQVQSQTRGAPAILLQLLGAQ